MKMKIIWALAVFFLIDSILRLIRSSFNLGTFLMYFITAALWIYAIFHKSIDSFCSHGLGYGLKIFFWAGCILFAGAMILIHILGHTVAATGQEQAVIVLGAGLRGERVTGLLARRLDAAYEYHLTNPDALIIVSGGQGPGESIPEAVAMKRYLVEKGIPENQILTETESTSTEENFAFSQEILRQNGIEPTQPIAYVTNTFHCYRAGLYARDSGFTDVSSVSATIGPDSILPCYMREVFAVAYYWVFKSPFFR